MIRTDAWQSQTIDDVQGMLLARDDVTALALFGSSTESSAAVDMWSDVDCILVVRDEAFAQFFPTTEWLSPLGDFFAADQSENSFHATTRFCFTDFRRIDFLIATESSLGEMDQWTGIPFWKGNRLLFSRSPQVRELLNRTWPAPKPTFASQNKFDEMANHFWYKAMLAGHKLIRDDQLIALHLALDLVRECCVLGMILRDRKEGTNVHRTGGIGNLIVAELQGSSASYTPAGILNMIEQSAVQFDRLAANWSDDYQERRHPLLEWTEQVRHTLKIG